MADDVTLKYPSGAIDGPPIRTLEDAAGRQWAVGVSAYVTTLGTPDVLAIPVASALADDMANPTSPLGGACLMAFDGAAWDRVRGDATNGLLVSVSGVVDVLPASPSAEAYLPVRLTDGTSFYAATGGGGGGGLTDTELRAAPIDVQGTVSISGGVAIAGVVEIANDGGNPIPVSGTVTVSDGGGSLTVDGTVGISGSVPVTGTFWQATQPVSLASVPSHAVTNAGVFAVQVSSALPAGTNNIGDVDVLTLPALPAGTNLIGRTSASPETSTVYNGTTALTPKFVKISGALSGNNTILPAVVGKKIRVLSYRFQAAGDVDVRFTDGAGGADLTGAMSTGAKGGGGGAAYSPVGHFETTANTALVMNLSGAVQVSGHLVYVEV